MHGLSPCLVRNADNGTLMNRGMTREHILNFYRIDILTTTDNHVFDTALEKQKPLGIELAGIARVIPPIFQGNRRLLWQIPVAGHDVVAARKHLASLPCGKVGAVLVDNA